MSNSAMNASAPKVTALLPSIGSPVSLLTLGPLDWWWVFLGVRAVVSRLPWVVGKVVNIVPKTVSVRLKEQNILVLVDTGIPFQDYLIFINIYLNLYLRKHKN